MIQRLFSPHRRVLAAAFFVASAIIPFLPPSAAHAESDAGAWIWSETRLALHDGSASFPRTQLRLWTDTRFMGNADGLAQQFLRVGPLFHVAPFLFVGVLGFGAFLRAIFGRTLGAVATGGATGAVVWLVSRVLGFAIGAGVIALIISLLAGLGGTGRGLGRRGPPWGGWGGGGFGGGGFGGGGGLGGGGFRGGGGGFGGGGASGNW